MTRKRPDTFELSDEVLQVLVSRKGGDFQSLAARCPDGFKPLIRGESLWFVSDYWLERLPSEYRTQLRILEPHGGAS